MYEKVLIQSAIDFVEQNITAELTIDDIAAAAKMSKFHFQRMFAFACGITIGEYLRNRRLSLAAK